MSRILLPVLALTALSALVPTAAHAQWGPMYPGYPTWRWGAPESDLRIDVTPKEASVYVDGYLAGSVDDFDGAFQRLHVPPGDHDIVVYLEGYRTLRQRLYLTPNRTRRIAGTLERLSPGEEQEPAPVPPDPPADADYDQPSSPGQRMPPPWTAGVPVDPRGRQPRTPPSPPVPPQPPTPSTPAEPDGRTQSTSATLSISVRPGGATVIVDGERWDGPADNNERLIVQVAEGHHTVEVQRDGYAPFVTELDVRGGQTVPVVVSMRRN